MTKKLGPVETHSSLPFQAPANNGLLLQALQSMLAGDFSVRLPGHWIGLEGKIADTFNEIVAANQKMAEELQRVGRLVGQEGRTRERVRFDQSRGAWGEMQNSINVLMEDLLRPTVEMTRAIAAVAKGDLLTAVELFVEGRALEGEFLHSATIVNTMIRQLNSFASEVTRVAREVGTEGKLGGQARVPGAAGTWKDLTESVNAMAGNLTAQVRNISEVTIAVANGDLSRKITVDVRGEILQLKEAINTMVDQLRSFASEVTRVAREVGTEGKLGGQAVVPGVAGTWKDLTDNVNLLAANLTTQVRNIAEVTTAVARGDLSRKITVDVKGEIRELKDTINTMVDQLNAFASEVTRVAREVGTEGKLGGQATVPGVAGTWKDLTDNVNLLAANLTTQVRNIAEVTTAVARGDLSRKITVDVKGEIRELKDTINTMVDQLNAFASEVTRVAREVGTEGKLGGQAAVPGVAGTWKDLTGNVNLLAANLTNQVRAIATVATAVTKGDLTRSIEVEALGEVAELKDNINTMINNLRLTTQHNQEQDWLKTNLALFTAMLQGQRDLTMVGRMLLSQLALLVDAHYGVIYRVDNEGLSCLTLLSAFSHNGERPHSQYLFFGEGLLGQCALEKRSMIITDIPEDAAPIRSGIFEERPRHIVVLPVLFEDEVKAVIELASLKKFTPLQIAFLEQLTGSMGIMLNGIEATMQTEGLLKQSQQLAKELQAQQEELQETNEQLAKQAQQLVERNVEVERKNREIEQARRALEEKAAELALTSKYKSEFLANMSHELRTPLNSILILGQELADNPEGNLSARQMEFARTIHGAGTDLLNLITDILDLSKIESGTVSVDAREVPLAHLLDIVSRPFRHEAESRRLAFEAALDPKLPATMITDIKRVQQVLKNLLSNAFKFTPQGEVRLSIFVAASGWTKDHSILSRAEMVVGFEVSDTGIGIPLDKQRIIFEAFQQADASTSRRFGGTGLGLAISRELAHLLGGEIQLRSAPEKGSAFTLYLPLANDVNSLAAAPPDMQADWIAALPAPNREEPSTAPGDDRHNLQPGDPVLLVVEDDLPCLSALSSLAREAGFKVLTANRGTDGLALAREFRPTAISLDLFLPDISGRTLLSKLKQDPATRHIPVQIFSVDDDLHHELAGGAFACLSKQAATEELRGALARLRDFALAPRHRLLLVQSDPAERSTITTLLGQEEDIEMVCVESGAAAMEKVAADQPFHCAVIDLHLSDMTGFELLAKLRDNGQLKSLPVVAYSGEPISSEEDRELQLLARSTVIKGAESPERLIDETSLFLHRDVSRLPQEKQEMLRRLLQSDDDLKGKRVLVVDDDVRNIFVLSSLLERHGMHVLSAGTGREAIAILEELPEIDFVLIDIMMPEMDGYETMQVIRQNPRFLRLPMVALTAKAMKGDREKCLDAGASDYLAKPVNADELLFTLRAWIHR